MLAITRPWGTTLRTRARSLRTSRAIHRTFGVAGALVFMAFSARLLAAQGATITVEVRQLGSGAPVAGALVSLLASGVRIDRALSSAQGEAELQGEVGSSYAIEVERVGFETASNDTVKVTSTAQRVTIFVDSRRVRLANVVVQGKQQCSRDSREGASAAAVWSEARKALEASLLAGSRRMRVPFPLTSTRYVRHLSRSQRIEREEIRRHSSSTAFVSAPAEELSRSGYLRDSSGTYFFYAPDAAVLLSDPFASDHCFTVTRRSDKDSAFVGLRFTPAPDRTLPEVSGTLWLDEASSELRYMEFAYENLPRQLDHPQAGGRVDFARLDDGRWIVESWKIRSPRFAYVTQTRVGSFTLERELQLVGFLDEGGVTAVPYTAGARTSLSARPAIAMGTVFDSTQNSSLAGAVVSLAGTNIADSTGRDGRFVLSSPLSGEYTINISHPRLALLGIGPLTESVRLASGDTSQLRIALPSSRSIVANRCRSTDTVSSPGPILLGIVRDSATLLPVAGAAVTVRWDRPIYRRSGTMFAIGADSSEIETASDSAGTFFVCGIPRDREVRVWANSGVATGNTRLGGYLSDSTWLVELDLRVKKTSARPAALAVSVRSASADARPLSAEVSLPNLARRLTPRGIGEFWAGELAPGEQAVVVRSLGYTPVERAIVLRAGDTARVEIALTATSVQLDEVRVEAAGGPAEFVRRRESYDGGTFVDRALIEGMERARLSDVLRTRARGVRLLNLGASGLVAAGARDASLGDRVCYMQIFLDGMKIFGLSQFNPKIGAPNLDQYNLTMLEAIEVYPGPSSTPPEFLGQDATCGTIVLWTRRD